MLADIESWNEFSVRSIRVIFIQHRIELTIVLLHFYSFEILPIQIDIDTSEFERDKRPTLTTRLLQKYVIGFT